MLKYTYVILLALAVPFAAHGEPVQPEAAPPDAGLAESAPAAAASADAPKATVPRGSAPRRKAPRTEPISAAPQTGDAIARLKNFIANTRTAQADFTQEVLDKNGKRTQSASGVMHFYRPGKFRWTYWKPYEQVIVGDGAKFWLYDVDLNQVTVRKLDSALGSSPAALLAGSHEIERDFALKNLECAPGAAAGQQAASQVTAQAASSPAATCAKDGLEWLEAKPKAPDSSFEGIRMGFNAQSDLVVMELRDSFGHVTVLRFSNMHRNPQLPPALFKFDPPKGVDVLGND